MSVIIAQGSYSGSVSYYYEDPMTEQQALLKGEKIVCLDRKELITVHGLDRLTWLNKLVTQKIDELRPGQSSEILFLTPQGRIEHWAYLVDDGQCSWLITEPKRGEALRQFLTSMRFAFRVDITNVTDDYTIFGAVHRPAKLLCGHDGKNANDPVKQLAQALHKADNDFHAWHDQWPEINEGGASYAEVKELQHPGLSYSWHEYIIANHRLDDKAMMLRQLAEAHVLAGVDALEALRVAAWRPRDGFDNDQRTIPHELDLMRTAVHLSKGCYKGQETVARVHNLGHPPRRLVFLHLDGSMHGLAPQGSVVGLNGKPVGFITSSGFHYELGPIALAVIKRTTDPQAELVVRVVDDNTGDNAVLQVGAEEYAAAQEIIVSPQAGAVAGKVNGDFLRKPPRRKPLI